MDVIKAVFSSTVFWTVISGVLVFVIGQLFVELFLKPLSRYNEIKAEIAYALVYYANVYLNPIVYNKEVQPNIELYKKASEELRILAAKITGFSQERRFLRIFIPVKRIEQVRHNLIGLSNGCVISSVRHEGEYVTRNEQNVKEIKRLLRLRAIWSCVKI